MNAETDARRADSIRRTFLRIAEERGVLADLVEKCHAAALQINAAIDLMIDERDHVANCSYEGFEEQERLNRIGRGCVNELDKRLGESFVKVRGIALRLWADGYVTYPPEDCGAEYAACCIECRQQWVWGGA